MKNIRIFIIVIILFAVIKSGLGQESDSQSLDNYLEIAAKNNPEVKAAFNQYLAALEKVPQVGSLPDPQASFGFFIKPMELLGGTQRGNIQIMQMFPWFGTLKSAKDEASMMALAKYEVFNATKSELFYQVKSAWYSLMKFDRETKLVNENIELLESLEKLALVKFESPETAIFSSTMQGTSNTGNSGNTMNSSGKSMSGMNNAGVLNAQTSGNTSASAMSEGMNNQQGGLQDVLRVKMEILELKNRLALLNDQRQTEQVNLNSLLNRDLETNVLISDSLIIHPLPVNRMTIPDSILSNNPMLAMLKNEANSYSLMEEKEKKMGLPMVGIGLNYMLIQEREGNTAVMNGKDMLMPMVSVSIPVYRKKYHAKQKEARLMQEATNEQSANLKNNLMVQYRLFIQSLEDAERRITLYEEQEKLAKKTTDILISGFTTSGKNYEEVLRMQQKVLDYSFKHIEAIADYNTSVAMAEKLMNSQNF
ncbi:MAG: TolC family protein [Bacteroidales bacterium]|nr:TolC family protein [Bacteroidales bacterium]